MSLERAVIEILDRNAIDPRKGLLPFIPVQFNPNQYTLNKAAEIAEIAIPGIDSPILQFVRGQNEKLTLDLFFDSTRPELNEQERSMTDAAIDVRLRTNAFYQLVKIQPRTHAPPRVRFHWARGISFKAIVESVQQQFTLFSPGGTPLRATLSVSFREYKTLEEQLEELNLQSADHTKDHVVRAGETLSDIAAREYGDPKQWKRIAEHRANRGIRNPLRLETGTRLVIPPFGGAGRA